MEEKTMLADQQITTESTITRDTPALNGTTQWVERITAALQETVEAIIATGKLLISAKRELGHGEFEQMIAQQLPFSSRTAQRLMSIAESPALTNPTHVSHLPTHWGTLYALSRLPARVVEEKIADGTITPRLQRADVTRKVYGMEPAATVAKRHTINKVQSLKKDNDDLRAHVAELQAAREAEPDPDPVMIIKAICTLATAQKNLDEFASLDGLPDRKAIVNAASWLVKLDGALLGKSPDSTKAKTITKAKPARRRA